MFARERTTVGLDIGASSVKVVEVEHREQGDRVIKFGEARLAPDVIVDGEVMDRQVVVQAIRDLFARAGIDRKRVVTGVHGRGVIVKKIAMERMPEEDAAEAIYWEAEQHVPYDTKDVSVDFQILDVDMGPKQMQVLLVAAKRDLILNQAEVVREAGLVIDAVDVNSFAVQNVIATGPGLPEDEVVALLNVGADITNVNVVRNGIPLYTQDLSLGGNSFLQAIQKSLALSREEVERTLQGESRAVAVGGLLEEFCSDLSSSLDKSLSYLHSAGEADQLDRILICGGGAQIEGLVEMLGRMRAVPIEAVDPLGGLSYAKGVFPDGDPLRIAPRLAVSVGLALRKERAA